jgi:hypothetical protein
MFVRVNRRGDYGCVCDPGFEGVDCELCEADAYPKPTGSNEGQMCRNIVPPSSCAHGEIKSDFDAISRPEMDLCDCDENFTSASMCTDCVSDHYGPACDILCQAACFESGGVCAITGCQCPDNLQLDFERQACVVCVENGCDNGGTCSNGRCRCRPGYYGDRCAVTAPRHEGRVCNEQGDVVLHTRNMLASPVYSASCLSDADCSDKTHENTNTRNMAIFAERSGWEMFCYLSDTPFSLRDVDGCCVDSGGVCLASNLSATFSECGDLGGDYVLDICNMRVLEGEVTVYDWCLGRQRNCTENGTCSDPEFCEGYDPTPVDWALRWNVEHFASMSSLMSEPLRFPVPFEDPYAYRRLYENVTLDDVCGALDVYSECRAFLLEEELVWDASLGRSVPVVDFAKCPQPERVVVSVNGTRRVDVTRQVWDRMHIIGGSGYAYLSGTAQRYMGTVGAEVDRVRVFGSGEMVVLVYNYVSDACESLQLRVSNFAQCSTLKIVELDYDWGDLCAWRFTLSASDGVFDDHAYRQSTACVGCEEYQEGCTGLPVNMSSPLPPPCADPVEGWDDFCVGFLKAEDVVGTCARLECDCDRSALGLGGAACELTCPVPADVPEPSACGSDQGWGHCVRTNAGALGMMIGECSELQCYRSV